jgi:hypothetical protein
MAIVAFNLFNPFSVMALGAILLKGLPMIVSGGMAVPTLQSVACHMGLMREFDIVEGDRPFLDADMTKGGTGHPGLKFFRSIGLIQNSRRLLCPVIRRIEEFKGIFNIVNTLPQQNNAVVMACFVEEILSLLKVPCPLPVPFEFI